MPSVRQNLAAQILALWGDRLEGLQAQIHDALRAVTVILVGGGRSGDDAQAGAGPRRGQHPDQ